MLSKDSLIQSLGSDYDYKIFRHFLGFEFKLNALYSSPFRNDSNPSFNIFEHKRNGKLYFKDLGADNRGDCFQLVQDINRCTFKEALEIVATSFGIKFDDREVKVLENIKYEKPKDFKAKEFTNIEYEPQGFTIYDREYWSQFGISSNTLRKFNVHSAKAIYIDNVLVGTYQNNNPIYVYEVNGRFKVYRPLTKYKDKWRSNLIVSDIFGLEQLPDRGELLIITKSLKDIMVLASFSLPAISANSENVKFPKKFIDKLHNRFDNILIYYDNDKAGILAAKRECKEHGLSYIHNEIGEPKDISDYVREYGIVKTQVIINKLVYGS